MGLSDSLQDSGLRSVGSRPVLRPRLDAQDHRFQPVWSLQYGDDPPVPFSFSTERIDMPQMPCHIAYTNERTHDIIRSGLDRSPLYSGVHRGGRPALLSFH